MINIAIDGPSGAGKSTLAKAIAKRLGFIYVDTGALYRAIGLYSFRNNVNISDFSQVELTLDSIEIDIKYENESQHVYLNEEDVSSDIRLPEISMYASTVSKIPKVREFLLNIQRDMAKKHNVIMDGRDIGTVILPDADVKFFLTATDEQRAKRRFIELQQKGIDTTIEQVLEDMRRRDEQDRTRDVAPAIPADDAIMFDNTELDFDATLDKAISIISEKVNLK